MILFYDLILYAKCSHKEILSVRFTVYCVFIVHNKLETLKYFLKWYQIIIPLNEILKANNRNYGYMETQSVQKE